MINKLTVLFPFCSPFLSHFNQAAILLRLLCRISDLQQVHSAVTQPAIQLEKLEKNTSKSNSYLQPGTILHNTERRERVELFFSTLWLVRPAPLCRWRSCWDSDWDAVAFFSLSFLAR